MITPARGYVLISPEQAESKTKDGLYLPDSGQDKPMKGTIVQIGAAPLPEYKFCLERGIKWESGYDIGDKVYFKKWSGETIRDGDQELVFIKFEEILGVISE